MKQKISNKFHVFQKNPNYNKINKITNKFTLGSN